MDRGMRLTLKAGDDLGDVRPSHAVANASDVPVDVGHEGSGRLNILFGPREDNYTTSRVSMTIRAIPKGPAESLDTYRGRCIPR